MKKPTTQPPKLYTWSIYHIRGTPGALLGPVEAPDEETAIKKAIDEFNIAPGGQLNHVSFLFFFCCRAISRSPCQDRTRSIDKKSPRELPGGILTTNDGYRPPSPPCWLPPRRLGSWFCWPGVGF